MGYFSKLADPGTSQHLAERCRDDYCQRLPCRMYKKGFQAGYNKGWIDGEAAGFASGYRAGFSAGIASADGG